MNRRRANRRSAQRRTLAVMLALGLVAACWLFAAMLVAIGGLLLTQACPSRTGVACAGLSSYVVVGHVMRWTGWALFVGGPVLALVLAAARRRAGLRRRMARLLASVAASWL